MEGHFTQIPPSGQVPFSQLPTHFLCVSLAGACIARRLNQQGVLGSRADRSLSMLCSHAHPFCIGPRPPHVKAKSNWRPHLRLIFWEHPGKLEGEVPPKNICTMRPSLRARIPWPQKERRGCSADRRWETLKHAFGLTIHFARPEFTCAHEDLALNILKGDVATVPSFVSTTKPDRV